MINLYVIRFFLTLKIFVFYALLNENFVAIFFRVPLPCLHSYGWAMTFEVGEA